MGSGPSLKSLSETHLSCIQNLFKNETGEHYIPDTIRALPIPIWKGNLILVDKKSQLIFTEYFGAYGLMKKSESRCICNRSKIPESRIWKHGLG